MSKNEIVLKDNDNLVAVFGTLKDTEGNYRVMEAAKGVLYKEDYVEFSRMAGSGFPVTDFESGTKKWLKVQIFKVPKTGVEGPLDTLEGYPTFYDRKIVTTKGGLDVIIYQIARGVANDESEPHLESGVHIPELSGKALALAEPAYYNWTGHRWN